MYVDMLIEMADAMLRNAKMYSTLSLADQERFDSLAKQLDECLYYEDKEASLEFRRKLSESKSVWRVTFAEHEEFFNDVQLKEFFHTAVLSNKDITNFKVERM